MKEQTSKAEISEILKIGKSGTLSFENFAIPLLELDKDTITSICTGNESKENYVSKSFKEKQGLHSSIFINSIYEIYNSLNDYTKSSLRLACSLYDLRRLTGATYNEISITISSAYHKKLSKSYISKLINAGSVLRLMPELERIGDIEKLASLASYGLEKLQEEIKISDKTILFDDLNLQTSSRSALSKKLKPAKVSSKPEVSSALDTLIEGTNSPIIATETLKLPCLQMQVEDVNRFDSLKEILINHLDVVKDFPELLEHMNKCIKLIVGDSHE